MQITKQKNDFPAPPEMTDWKIWDDLFAKQILHFNWTRWKPKVNEVDLRNGVKLTIDFADPELLLESAFTDLTESLNSAGLLTGDKAKYTISVCQDENIECSKEAYHIQIENTECTLRASDTEGMRRAIYHFEEMLMISDGPFLRRKTVKTKSWLKNRISRSPFYPTNRPPHKLNGLDDNIDYYPEAYLSRLAREGTNALWLEVNFTEICHTFLYSDSTNMEKRLIKLRAIVEKCRRYGIRIFVLGIEPAGIQANDQILEKYPELAGFNWGGGKRSFCPSTEVGQRYLYDAVYWLFSQIPKLGGMINITLGEACSSCLHCGKATDPNPPLDHRQCPRCSKLIPSEVLSNVLTPMRQGMTAAAPNADLICWFYHAGTENTVMPWVSDLAKNIPEGVILLYNFESGMVVEQVGKAHLAGDYWQSQVGPSARFISIAELACANKTEVAAKIQVSNSHELASVPIVPVPGILFKKYKAMHNAGISSVMQCWYFGGFPGIMNRAAGRLAFFDFCGTEDDFLSNLAIPEWQNSANLTVKAWVKFEEAYSCYPVSQVFQYYGPVHTGVVWPLFFEPQLKSLSPNWLESQLSGDAIGECLRGYTLDEAVYLCRRMSIIWEEGLVYLRQAGEENSDSKERQIDLNLAEVIGIQLESAFNILKFYLLRKKLSTTNSNSSTVLSKMTRIIKTEILHSKKMIDYCEQDSRLGYNSEAENYKYYPELLNWRISQLKGQLKKELPRVQQQLTAGQIFCDINKLRPESYTCNSGWHDQKTFRWRVEQTETNLQFSFENLKNDFTKKADLDQICMLLGDAHAVTFPMFLIFRRGVGLFGQKNQEIKTEFIDKDGVWCGFAEIPFGMLPEEFPGEKNVFNIFRQYFQNKKEHFDSWRKVSTRGFCFCNYDPAGMGRILPTGENN